MESFSPIEKSAASMPEKIPQSLASISGIFGTVVQYTPPITSLIEQIGTPPPSPAIMHELNGAILECPSGTAASEFSGKTLLDAATKVLEKYPEEAEVPQDIKSPFNKPIRP
jgi:hypothetical protein